MSQVKYRAFGRDFDTVAEAETHGRNLMADKSQWTYVEAPTSFVLFIVSEACLPVVLWRVHLLTPLKTA